MSKGCKKYNVLRDEQGNTLVVDCKECDGECNLSSPKCFSGVFNIFVSEYPINSIVLSGFFERKYGSKACSILESLRDVVISLESMAESRTMNREECKKCALNPRVMFLALRNAMLEDISEFYKRFILYAQKVSKVSDIECTECTLRSGGDLVYIHDMMERLRRRLRTEAGDFV
ncbi:MAG: hypothetical protein DRN20_05630 [Thermoplasmata archaeon]|nr:MAG: hypothetical protein DRN20_05630 [Thermoplasmata archaeon]